MFGESFKKPALNDSLMGLVVSSENMRKAWKQVRSNKGSPGVDAVSIEDFPEFIKSRWSKIKRSLLEGYYIPSPVLRVEIA